MPYEYVATIDGKEVKVEIPDTFIQAAVKDTHLPKDSVAKDLDKRAQAIVKNQGLRKPEDMMSDADFVAQVLEKHGQKRNTQSDDAAAQQLRDALARQAKDIATRDIEPLKRTLEEKSSRERSLLIRDLERQIIQAAAPHVKDGLLKAPKDRPAPIVTLLEDAFAYDEETGEFYAAEGDNFVISGSGESTYKTVAEYVQDWVASKENADWLRPGQAGSGATGGTGRRGEAGSVTLTAEEASDARVYGKALEKVGGDHSKIRVNRGNFV